MLNRKYLPIQECKVSTFKIEYQYLNKKRDEYGNDFIICKFLVIKILIKNFSLNVLLL